MPSTNSYSVTFEAFLADAATPVELSGMIDSIASGDWPSAAAGAADTALSLAAMVKSVPGWASFSAEAAQLGLNAGALKDAIKANDPNAIRTKTVAVLGSALQIASALGLTVAATAESVPLATAAAMVGIIGIHASFAGQILDAQDKQAAKQVAEIGAFFLDSKQRFGLLKWNLVELNAIQTLQSDAPALFTAVNTLAFLDPTLALSTAESLVFDSSNGGSIQDASEALAEIQRTLFGQHPSLSTTNAEFFAQADSLFNVARWNNGTFKIRPWPTQNLILSDAEADSARRAAVLLGAPFFIEGANYAPRLTGAELDESLYDPETGVGSVSSKYLADRAMFLASRQKRNRGDDARAPAIGGAPATVRFFDYGLGQEVVAGEPFLPNNQYNNQFIEFGSRQDETLLGGALGDRLYGGAGSDTVGAGDGDDYVEGQAGNDVLLGGNGEDEIHGGKGDDRLDGGAENDELYGGLDNDELIGGAGSDVLKGGSGQTPTPSSAMTVASTQSTII